MERPQKLHYLSSRNLVTLSIFAIILISTFFSACDLKCPKLSSYATKTAVANVSATLDPCVSHRDIMFQLRNMVAKGLEQADERIAIDGIAVTNGGGLKACCLFNGLHTAQETIPAWRG